MITIDKICVMNFENALRGARNPMNSWAKSDSYTDASGTFCMGENDLALCRRLCLDITAPLYWWKEFDTYKVATVANSTSTMHKIHAKPFSRDDFSHDRLSPAALQQLDAIIAYLEKTRLAYLETKDKALWYDMIQLLPSSYEQLRTVTLNYETLTNMYYARRHHRLAEWHTFCETIETLPYAKDLICCKD